ncbi:hypothetical protein VTO42DRAFT_4888 [Malbranchea cinnamomea]
MRLLLLAILGLWTALVFSQAAPPGTIIVYSEKNYTGESRQIRFPPRLCQNFDDDMLYASITYSHGCDICSQVDPDSTALELCDLRGKELTFRRRCKGDPDRSTVPDRPAFQMLQSGRHRQRDDRCHLETSKSHSIRGLFPKLPEMGDPGPLRSAILRRSSMDSHRKMRKDDAIALEV